jgi:hypothetical protein
MCNFTTGKSHEIAVEFYRGHSMYDAPLYESLQAACGGFSDEGVTGGECQRLLNEMSTQIGTFDIYNIYGMMRTRVRSHARTPLLHQTRCSIPQRAA